jgi:hypothetical protein
MGLNTLRWALILCIVLMLTLVPSFALKISMASGECSGTLSTFEEYRLEDSASLSSQIAMGDSTVSRQSLAMGEGENMASQGISSGGGTITHAFHSDGSFISASRDFAAGSGAISHYRASLAGSSGSAITTSTGQENQMTVAGGFSGEGDMDVSLHSIAAQEGLTTGTGYALGMPRQREYVARIWRPECVFSTWPVIKR